MLKAVLFDFNGVLVDDEHIHLELFQEILAHYDLSLTEKDYFDRYFTYSDLDFLTTIFAENKRKIKRSRMDKLIQKKNKRYMETIATRSILYEDARKTVEMFSGAYTMGIVSGALREEIETVLKKEDLDQYFNFVVAAEDVSHGKPDPEGYVVALNLINNLVDLHLLPVQPSECLVIEDSPSGVQSARSIGMRCIGVANTVERGQLVESDLVYDSLKEIRMERLRTLYIDPLENMDRSDLPEGS